MHIYFPIEVEIDACTLDVPFGGIITRLHRKMAQTGGTHFPMHLTRTWSKPKHFFSPFFGASVFTWSATSATKPNSTPNSTQHVPKYLSTSTPFMDPTIPVRVPSMVNLAKHWAPHVPILSFLHVIYNLDSLLGSPVTGTLFPSVWLR